jgi:hypothetical protein
LESAQVFDLSVTYDAASLRAAATVLFRRYFRSISIVAAGGLVVLLGTTLWAWFSLRIVLLIWFFAFIAIAQAAALAYSRWNIQRRLSKSLGKTAQIRLTGSDMSITLDGESHTLPWERFKSVIADEYNVYLFVTKTATLILPMRNQCAEARAFVVSQVRPDAV